MKRLLIAALLIALAIGPASIASRAETVKADVELTTKEIDTKEAVLGDLVADAIKGSANTDMAFIAASSFRDGVTIAKGSVNSTEIVDTLVYKGESIVIVKLTGEQVQKAIEQSLFLFPRANSAFLQVSGVSVNVRPDSEAGKRVGSIKIGADSLDPKHIYRVAMPAPLANGALAYFKIWSKTAVEKDTDVTVETALTGYLADHKTITKGEDRLVTRK